MEIEKYLNKEKETQELIWKFAFLGKNRDREKKIEELAEMAEKENWTSSHSGWKNDILYSYFTHTFNKAARDTLILISDTEEYSCFNTGLLTDNGEDIICIFNRFEKSNEYE